MFGKSAPVTAKDARDSQYTQTYEYLTLTVMGVGNFDKMLNQHAAKGWELVNGCMAGTMHYGYLRRRLRTAGDAAATPQG